MFLVNSENSKKYFPMGSYKKNTMWYDAHNSSASLHFIKYELSMNVAYSCNCVLWSYILMSCCWRHSKSTSSGAPVHILFVNISFIYSYDLIILFMHVLCFWSVTPLKPSSPIPQLLPKIFFLSISRVLFLNLRSN